MPTRREFLKTKLAALGSLAAAGRLAADPLGLPLGFQVYPIAKEFVSDVSGTLKMLAGLGYRSVEMCSPPGYKNLFGPLMEMSGSELRRRFEDAGMVCHSSHYQFSELKQSLPERIAYARELGLTQMIIASLGLPQKATLDDWRRAADEANPIGEQIRKAGLQLGFHNHGMELQQLEGVLIYDELMRHFDRDLVKMQCQLVDVARAGMDPAEFSGRFISLHLADRSADGKPAPVGKGTLDWKAIFQAARQAGVKNYYVEVNMELLKESAPFLKSLNV
jgi:sugar phosphate isomerase/epimerase